MKLKNRPDYVFNDSMIVNIKDLDSSLLEINYHLRVFLVLVFITLNTSLQKVLIVWVMIELIMMKIFFILFLGDLDRYIEKNNGIKYLVFDSTDKNNETLKNYKKL